MNVPDDLRDDGRALFAAVGAYLDEMNAELDPHEVAVLHEACRTADRLAQLRDALAGVDLTEPTSVRLLAEERQQRAALATLLVTKLGLPTGIDDSTPRQRRASTAATARWEQAPTGSKVSDAARDAASARWRK